MLHLRTVYGVDTSDFEACFGKSFEQMYSSYLNKYIEGGYMKKTGTDIILHLMECMSATIYFLICSILTESLQTAGRTERHSDGEYFENIK